MFTILMSFKPFTSATMAVLLMVQVTLWFKCFVRAYTPYNAAYACIMSDTYDKGEKSEVGSSVKCKKSMLLTSSSHTVKNCNY